MVEAINNVQTPVVTKKDNALRNGLIAAVVGAGIGDVAGYQLKQIVKDGAFTDEFIKETQNQFITSMSDTKAEKDVIIDLQNMGENPQIDAVRKFFKKHSRVFFEDEEHSGYIKKFLQKSDSEIMKEFNVIKSDYDVYVASKLNLLSEKMKNFLEKTQFKPTEALKENVFYESILKAQHNIKFKAGAIIGAASGLVLGAGAYLATKFSGKKEA